MSRYTGKQNRKRIKKKKWRWWKSSTICKIQFVNMDTYVEQEMTVLPTAELLERKNGRRNR